MEKLQKNDTRIDFPTNDELNIKHSTFQLPQYNYELLPSSQSLSFESSFISQEITSVGPMYYKS